MPPGKIRVRFAPSPTGFLHVGAARTALFNWLFARHHEGTFILRIEDTDRLRSTEVSLGGILDGLRWLGMEWDEGPEIGGAHGPYFQMERLEGYQRASESLLKAGKAYLCYCTPQELEDRRLATRDRGEPPRYDRRCRELADEEKAEFLREGRKPAVRFAMPLEGETLVRDLIRGEVSFRNDQLEDLVILKASGVPTYNFANVVDDHDMAITHVIRADEHLANTPKQIRIYDALALAPPQFAHPSIILGEDRKKLSKRHGATSVGEYRSEGYLPEAMVNFLALLGWSYDDRTEIFSAAELSRHFTLDRVNPAPAIFSLEKLDWLNGLYIRQLGPEDLAKRLVPVLEEAGVPVDRQKLPALIPLVQERMRTLQDAVALVDFFFSQEISYSPDLLLGKKLNKDEALRLLSVAESALESLTPFEEAAIETRLRNLAREEDVKAGVLFGVIRVAVTGRTVAPPLFGTLAILGRDQTLERLRQAETGLRRLVPQGTG
ncbi:MAG: glutamate--tRNA ligase [Anaerolineae bacterium]